MHMVRVYDVGEWDPWLKCFLLSQGDWFNYVDWTKKLLASCQATVCVLLQLGWASLNAHSEIIPPLLIFPTSFSIYGRTLFIKFNTPPFL